MRFEDWTRVIDEAAELGCRSMQFIGGEPLLYPELDELIDVANNRGFEFIEVFTNATAVTPKRAEQFARWNVHVACSVYAADANTHDRVTAKPGSFDRTVAGLTNLARKSVPIRIGFIEMEANRGEFDRTRAFLSSIGIERVSMDSVREFGRGEAIAEGPRADSKFAGLCGQCSRGRLCVTNTGEVYPCIMSRTFPVGDVLDGGLRNVFHGHPIRDFRTEMDAEIWGASPACEPKNMQDCNPTTTPCMVCGPGACRPDWNPCVPEVPSCGPPEVA